MKKYFIVDADQPCPSTHTRLVDDHVQWLIILYMADHYWTDHGLTYNHTYVPFLCDLLISNQ